MPDPISAGIATVGSLAKGAIGASSAKKAGRAQAQAAQAGIEEQRRANDELRRLLDPYVAAGGPALQAQMAALGLAGQGAQQDFVAQQEQNPLFQALARQGEEAILQRASATGGLRGGNVQGALAQFRPGLLNQFIQQQYERLGGMVNLGQGAAAGVGRAGLDVASNIGNLLTNQGQARAGSALGVGQAWGNTVGDLTQLAGMAVGRGGFGGGGSPAMPNMTEVARNIGGQLGGTYKPLPFGGF